MNRLIYIAFLRGINVGNHKIVKMEALKKIFEMLEFKNIKTVLNSGNILFETSRMDPANITKQIEEKLEQAFGYKIDVMVRSNIKIQSLVNTNPFKAITVTPLTRLYVTFLTESPHTKRPISFTSPDKDFEIIKITDTDVCSVLTLSSNKGTPDLMKVIEKEFGKKITTRSWNTIMRIAKILKE